MQRLRCGFWKGEVLAGMINGDVVWLRGSAWISHMDLGLTGLDFISRDCRDELR